MHYYEVAPTKIFRHDSDFLTYHSETQLKIGQIVKIEIGKSTIVGIVYKKVASPKYKTKSITSVIYEKPIPKELLNTLIWIASYYSTPLASTIQLALPTGISKVRRLSTKNEANLNRKRTNFLLNTEQLSAIDRISSGGLGTYILHGVTGSGKTAVYIEMIKRCIQNNTSAILLVPEIALTSQLTAELQNTFPKQIALFHSKVSEAKKHNTWSNVLLSDQPMVIVGTRSALFLPICNIGLIILDESHDSSYKQDKNPKYSALRVAAILAKQHECRVILGSATPNIADYYLASSINKHIIELPSQAQTDRKPPNIKIVDSRKRVNFSKHRFLSNDLINAIDKTLENKNQVLIFHNRRGSANISMCKDCGWIAQCETCQLPLTLHHDEHRMRCHICGKTKEVNTTCPICNSANIMHKGIGTKLIETELSKLFPKAIIGRFDTDNTAKQTLDKRYQEIYDSKIDILIGTQVVAKGLDLPNLRTVGIIQADSGITIPDYNSTENTFQLLTQVIGRVGRSHHDTSVIVQTYKPEHPAIQMGIRQDYTAFYEHELSTRRKTRFPPFVFLLKLTCAYKTEAIAIKNSQAFARNLRSKFGSNIQIMGPAPAFYEKTNENYRWQIIVKSSRRETLLKAIQELPPSHWQYDIDPTSLL